MDPGDLADNRRGLLGPGQRARLEALIASYRKGRFALGPAADMARAFVVQLRRALEDGRVVAATGEVGIDLPAFRAGITEGRKHDLPGNFESAYVAALDGGGSVKLAPWLGLLPGRHELYVSAWAGFVVGASPLPPFDHAQRFFVAVCAAQSLSAETLEENRRGFMTEAQKRTLGRDKATSWRDIALAYTVGLLVASFPILELSGLMHFKKMSITRAVFDCVVISFILVIGTWVLVDARRVARAKVRDVEEGRCTAFEGPLHKNISVLRASSLVRKIEISVTAFDVTDRAELYATLIPGFACRVYVAPRSAYLLAIEPLPQEQTVAVVPP